MGSDPHDEETPRRPRSVRKTSRRRDAGHKAEKKEDERARSKQRGHDDDVKSSRASSRDKTLPSRSKKTSGSRDGEEIRKNPRQGSITKISAKERPSSRTRGGPTQDPTEPRDTAAASTEIRRTTKSAANPTYPRQKLPGPCPYSRTGKAAKEARSSSRSRSRGRSPPAELRDVTINETEAPKASFLRRAVSKIRGRSSSSTRKAESNNENATLRLRRSSSSLRKHSPDANADRKNSDPAERAIDNRSIFECSNTDQLSKKDKEVTVDVHVTNIMHGDWDEDCAVYLALEVHIDCDDDLREAKFKIRFRSSDNHNGKLLHILATSPMQRLGDATEVHHTRGKDKSMSAQVGYDPYLILQGQRAKNETMEYIDVEQYRLKVSRPSDILGARLYLRNATVGNVDHPAVFKVPVAIKCPWGKGIDVKCDLVNLEFKERGSRKVVSHDRVNGRWRKLELTNISFGI